MLRCKSLALSAAAIMVLFAGGAQAIPFQITSQLTGDPRPENPDGIVVNITIDADTESSLASWHIDLDSAALHPEMKLHEFYFNVLGTAGDYVFSNFSPAAWTTQLNDVVKGGGGGGATFLFEVIDPPGGAKTDVTNNVLLSFDMTKLTGFFNPADFTSAPNTSTSAGFNSQMGAHLQSLNKVGSLVTSDSGFATGNYNYDPDPIVVLTVPEPGLLLLLSSGLLGMTIIRRRSPPRKM